MPYVPQSDLLAEIHYLRARLVVAERVCALFGSTCAHHMTDPEKALHELWSQWRIRYGAEVPRIGDDEIAALAHKRDATVAATLIRIRTEAAAAAGSVESSPS